MSNIVQIFTNHAFVRVDIADMSVLPGRKKIPYKHIYVIADIYELIRLRFEYLEMKKNSQSLNTFS